MSRALLPLLAALITLVAAAPQPPDAQLLQSSPVYLGVVGEPEWDAFAGRTPAGTQASITFDGRANTVEHALVITQADVKQEWTVFLNDRAIGPLERMEADLVHVLAVPAGSIHTGANTLRIASKSRDDVVLRRIALHAEPVESLLSRGHLRVTVRGENGTPVPARVTVIDADGALAALRAAPGVRQAVRAGVVYTGGDTVAVGLLPGTYRVAATRGPEYALREARVTIGAGTTESIELRLNREVPTDGWVAADTHIHTRELSGHGDATVAERVLTLAGEGVELAIATEHNREADYGLMIASMGVRRYVTTISGNEVTTSRGHFNVFPSRAIVVNILNHPHDVHGNFAAFGPANFHRVTGRSRNLEHAFDAMELVNSGAMRSDWMEPVRSWFALLNRGQLVTPIGASDSHDVSRFIVGQGRTYVRVADAQAGSIDVEAAVASIHASRTSVSLGLFADARIGTAGPGDFVRTPGATVEARVLGPTWMAANRVALFVNGEELEHVDVPADSIGRVEKARIQWQLPQRRLDYHVVVVASGPGVTDPAWAVPRPYQPTTPRWTPVVLAITSPIRVDADGDGTFTSPRGYAERLVERHAAVSALLAALADQESIVSAHAAELLERRGVDPRGTDVRTALGSAAPAVREGFSRYLAVGR